MVKDSNLQAFFELIRAGLWEKDVELQKCGAINFSEVYSTAERQSVVGLIAAGLEHITDVKVPQVAALQFAGTVMLMDQRNKAMNAFIAKFIDKLYGEGINCILVKGQGIAQCYERPSWRTSGDVDLLLSNDNYNKVRIILTHEDVVFCEDKQIQHLEMELEGWAVELHGTLRGGLWRNLDKEIDNCQNAICDNGKIRPWLNNNTQVNLPNADEDVVLVFAHILQHFFKGGIGLRQICDWCRLLYTYKGVLDLRLLESRLKDASIMTEWKAFAAMAVEHIGMPVDAMPFYDATYSSKGERVLAFVLETGNFGHSRDESYKQRVSFISRLFISFLRRIKDTYKHFRIFPLDALKAWMTIVGMGVRFVIGKFNA